MAPCCLEDQAKKMGGSRGLSSTVGCALISVAALATSACFDGDDRALRSARRDHAHALAGVHELQAVRNRLRDKNADLRRAVRKVERANLRLQRQFTRSLKGLRSENRGLVLQVRSLEGTLNAVTKTGHLRALRGAAH